MVFLGLGALASQVWLRYLGRLSAFRWSAWHNRLAISGEDPQLGKVEVLWNGLAVKHLQFCNIEIENESSRDFSNVAIRFWYTDGTEILSETQLSGTTQFMPWTTRYNDAVAKATEVPEDKRDSGVVHNLLARREYVVPVFNRGTRFTITNVVSSAGDGPVVHVACDHEGVRLYERPQRPMVFGVVQTQATWIGVFAAVLVTVGVAYFTNRTWLIASVAFITAAFGQLLGAGIVHAKRWVARTIA